MAPPLIVFDLDGTLIDTAPDLIGTLNVVLASDGLPTIREEEARTLIGAGIRPLIERALAENRIGAGEELTEHLFARFIRHYQEHIADHSRPFPGLEQAMQRLSALGFIFAVCTNKYESLSVRLLEALDLARHFACICGQDTFSVKKPHPDALLQTIARAGGDPARSIMVGDSATDVHLARAARIPVIGVDFGYTPVPMAELAPDRLISHFVELPQAIADLIPMPESLRSSN